MPPHDSTPETPRGAHLLEAVFAILADDGLGALSMRAVATRADVSLAQVQYYFRSKTELVAAAFDYASDEFLRAVTAVADTEPSLGYLREVIWMWLPLDEEREKRARVWLAFTAIAATDKHLATTAAQLDADLQAWFSQQLERLRRAERVRADLNTQAAAAQLLALIDGLTVHALVLPVDQRENLTALTLGSWLDDLVATPSPGAPGFGGSPVPEGER